MANDTIDDQRRTRKRLQEENESQMVTLVERETTLVDLKGQERKTRKMLTETRESLSSELAKLETGLMGLRKDHAKHTMLSRERAAEIVTLEAQRDELNVEHDQVTAHVSVLDDERFQLKVAIDNLELDLKRTVQERVRMESDFEELKVSGLSRVWSHWSHSCATHACMHARTHQQIVLSHVLNLPHACTSPHEYTAGVSYVA
eukprot:Opistho-2@47416